MRETYTHGADLSGSLGGGAGGIGGILASSHGNSSAFYHYDFNGNVVSVTSATQSPLAAYTYSPFGEVLLKSGPFASRFQFSSKEFDALTGLNYYGYRFYSAEKGRWINRDPIQEQGGRNLYMFVYNSQFKLIDPLGLESNCDQLRSKIADLKKLINDLKARISEKEGRLENLLKNLELTLEEIEEAQNQAEAWKIIAVMRQDALNNAKNTCEGLLWAPSLREMACKRIPRLESLLEQDLNQIENWLGRRDELLKAKKGIEEKIESIKTEIENDLATLEGYDSELEQLNEQVKLECCNE